MNSAFYILIFSFFICTSTICNAQSNLESCSNHLHTSFISDGQYTKIAIKKNDIKTIQTTLLAGNTYRIIVCAANSNQTVFTLSDPSGNILFSNKDYKYTPYWDFEIKHTIECTISIFIEDESITKDEIIYIIGYKKNK